MKNEQINNKKIFNQSWKDWVEMKIHGPASRWLRSLVGDIIEPINKGIVKNVLDVGCGDGRVTFEIAKIFPSATIIGIDFSKAAILLAKRHYVLPNLNFKYDLRSHLLSQQYDLITAFEILEHVDNWESLLRRMIKSSNRYLLISFPTGGMRPFEKNVGHFRNFKKGEVENFLTSEGFMPVDVYYAGFPFYSPIYRELCNLTNSANNSFTRSKKYGLSQKFVSSILFLAFRYLSSKHNYGDQFCGLFEKVNN